MNTPLDQIPVVGIWSPYYGHATSTSSGSATGKVEIMPSMCQTNDFSCKSPAEDCLALEGMMKKAPGNGTHPTSPCSSHGLESGSNQKYLFYDIIMKMRVGI